MARLVDLGGSPANATEREIVQRLVADLPPGWSVIPNVSLPEPRTGHPYEIDAIVVGPHAVYLVEVKGWRGTIRELGRADWQLSGGKVEKNPMPLADQKARVLKSALRTASLGGRKPPYVQACLVVGSDDTVIDVFSADRRRCLRPSDVAPWMLDPSRLSSGEPPGDYRAVHDALVEAITGSLKARSAVGRRFGSYVATSLQQRDDESATWLARHALLDDGRTYRVRTWTVSAYRYTPPQQQERIARLRRSAEALARVGDHPNVATLRDFGEQDGEFYEVTDWSEHGTLQTAFLRGALGRLPIPQRVSIVRDVAAGLAAAAAQGVFHRALSPETVLLTPDGHARLVDFDRAFLEGAEGTVYGGHPAPHAQFAPPELRDPADYDVFDNSDLFSLARMARFLFEDDLPPSVLELLARCEAQDPSERPTDPAAFLALIDGDVAPAAPAPELPARPGLPQPGDVIDGVNTVVGELGRGAGTRVYRVINEPLGGELALKLVVAPPDGYDAAGEYRLLRAVTSEHVPRAHWLGRLARSDGQPLAYLLLDLVEGERLRDVIDRGPVPLDQALAWADDLLDALDALHAGGGSLHRDVKPENVVVGPRGAVLLDFGTARPVTDRGRAPEGTLAYTPPDLPQTGWTEAADLFALGCVLHELLTGRHPWDGAAPSADRAPAPLGDVPEAVATLVAASLAPRAELRPHSAADLRAALRSAATAPPRPTTTTAPVLEVVREEAGRAVWSGRLVQALARHPDVLVPLALAVRDAVVTPADDSPEAAEAALIATEAALDALEGPLPDILGSAYDLLARGTPPAAWTAAESGDPTAAQARIDAGDRLLVLDGLHPVEWPVLEEAAAHLGCSVERLVWAARPDAAGPGVDPPPALEGAMKGHDLARLRVVSLPRGDRAAERLGNVLVRRRALIEGLLLDALAEPSVVWLTATWGTAYLGHGLRRDVGEGLGAHGDVARGTWSAVFGNDRSAPIGPRLPCVLARPTREAGGRRYPVGRLAWPDPPGTPWLLAGGLSLPERLLPLFRLSR